LYVGKTTLTTRGRSGPMSKEGRLKLLTQRINICRHLSLRPCQGLHLRDYIPSRSARYDLSYMPLTRVYL